MEAPSAAEASRLLNETWLEAKEAVLDLSQALHELALAADDDKFAEIAQQHVKPRLQCIQEKSARAALLSDIVNRHMQQQLAAAAAQQVPAAQQQARLAAAAAQQQAAHQQAQLAAAVAQQQAVQLQMQRAAQQSQHAQTFRQLAQQRQPRPPAGIAVGVAPQAQQPSPYMGAQQHAAVAQAAQQAAQRLALAQQAARMQQAAAAAQRPAAAPAGAAGARPVPQAGQQQQQQPSGPPQQQQQQHLPAPAQQQQRQQAPAPPQPPAPPQQQQQQQPVAAAPSEEDRRTLQLLWQQAQQQQDQPGQTDAQPKQGSRPPVMIRLRADLLAAAAANGGSKAARDAVLAAWGITSQQAKDLLHVGKPAAAAAQQQADGANQGEQERVGHPQEQQPAARQAQHVQQARQVVQPRPLPQVQRPAEPRPSGDRPASHQSGHRWAGLRQQLLDLAKLRGVTVPLRLHWSVAPMARVMDRLQQLVDARASAQELAAAFSDMSGLEPSSGRMPTEQGQRPGAADDEHPPDAAGPKQYHCSFCRYLGKTVTKAGHSSPCPNKELAEQKRLETEPDATWTVINRRWYYQQAAATRPAAPQRPQQPQQPVQPPMQQSSQQAEQEQVQQQQVQQQQQQQHEQHEQQQQQHEQQQQQRSQPQQPAAANSPQSRAAAAAGGAAERSSPLEAACHLLAASRREVADESLAVLQQQLFLDRGKPCLSLAEARKELEQLQVAYFRLPPAVHLPDGGQQHWREAARLERYVELLLSSQAEQAAPAGEGPAMQSSLQQAAAVPRPTQPPQQAAAAPRPPRPPPVPQQQQQPMPGAARPLPPAAVSAGGSSAQAGRHHSLLQAQLRAQVSGHPAAAAVVRAAVGRSPSPMLLSPTPPAVQSAVALSSPQQAPLQPQPVEYGEVGRKRGAEELPADELLAPPAKRSATPPPDATPRASSPPVHEAEPASRLEQRPAAQAPLAAALAASPASSGAAAALPPAVGLASRASPAAEVSAIEAPAAAAPGPANGSVVLPTNGVQPAAAPAALGGAGGPAAAALPSCLYVLTDSESEEDDIIDIT